MNKKKYKKLKKRISKLESLLNLCMNNQIDVIKELKRQDREEIKKEVEFAD